MCGLWWQSPHPSASYNTMSALAWLDQFAPNRKEWSDVYGHRLWMVLKFIEYFCHNSGTVFYFVNALFMDRIVSKWQHGHDTKLRTGSATSNTDVRDAVRRWLFIQTETFYQKGPLMLVVRWTKHIFNDGDYIEKQCICYTAVFFQKKSCKTKCERVFWCKRIQELTVIAKV